MLKVFLAGSKHRSICVDTKMLVAHSMEPVAPLIRREDRQWSMWSHDRVVARLVVRGVLPAGCRSDMEGLINWARLPAVCSIASKRDGAPQRPRLPAAASVGGEASLCRLSEYSHSSLMCWAVVAFFPWAEAQSTPWQSR